MRGKGYGVLMDLVLGLVGAVVGGFVFGLLGLHGYGLVGQLVVATAGAVMLIWLVRRSVRTLMKRILNGYRHRSRVGRHRLGAGRKRPLSLDDLGKIKDVRDPQCAPDGKRVAYVVSQIDVKEDKPGSGHIWTVGIDGQNERQITSSNDSESSPRFSPDGKYLSFTSSRPARRRATRCGCSIAAAARRFS